jgi:hypothetical protein
MVHQKLFHSQRSHFERTPSVRLTEEAATPKFSMSAQSKAILYYLVAYNISAVGSFADAWGLVLKACE